MRRPAPPPKFHGSEYVLGNFRRSSPGRGVLRLGREVAQVLKGLLDIQREVLAQDLLVSPAQLLAEYAEKRASDKFAWPAARIDVVMHG
jgi:hypothetical protein